MHIIIVILNVVTVEHGAPKFVSSRECDFGYKHGEVEEFASKSWNERH